MDNGIPENTELTKQAISALKSSDGIDFLGALKSLASLTTLQNAPLILGAIVAIQGREVRVETENRPDVTETLNSIKSKLDEVLPAQLRRLIPASDITLVDMALESHREISLMKALENIVIDTLVKRSKHEIWNSLNVYFNDTGVIQALSRDCIIKHIFTCLTTAVRINKASEDSEECISIIRELSFLSTEEDAAQLLDLFQEAPQYFDVFLIALRSSNGDVYAALQNLVYTEKKYFKESIVCAFPGLEFSRVVGFIKDYNWDVTAGLLRVRPALAKDLIEAFHRGELGISRKFFLEAVQKQGDVFSNFITELNLTSEELVDTCTRSYSFTKKYFYLIETEDQMLQFCKLLSKREESRVLGFVKEVEGIPAFELFLKTLLKMSRLTGELKTYITEKYSDNPAYFNCLLSYLDMENVEALLEKYYEKNVTLELLLRRFYPQELIIELHRFHNTVLSSSLLADCIESQKFEDKDWVMAMKSLDAVRSHLKSTTSLLILQRKPNLRQQTISFLKTTVSNTLWDSQAATEDFVRCLELLKEDCFAIFPTMTKNEIIFVFKKSRYLENTVRTFLKNYNGSLPPNLMFIWNCLRMV